MVEKPLENGDFIGVDLCDYQVRVISQVASLNPSTFLLVLVICWL